MKSTKNNVNYAKVRFAIKLIFSLLTFWAALTAFGLIGSSYGVRFGTAIYMALITVEARWWRD